MKIDPARVARLLQSLAYPDIPRSTAAKSSSRSSPHAVHARGDLRTNLRMRISEAIRDGADEPTLGVLIVQEILIWEFGPAIAGTQDFKDIATNVARTMLADPKMQRSFARLTAELFEK